MSTYLDHIHKVAQEDAEGLRKAHQDYGSSCLKRGGVGLFMMLARKWDRLENLLSKSGAGQWNILEAIKQDSRPEGIIDDIRDLRRYLNIVEAEARAQGCSSAISKSRDNLSPPTSSVAPFGYNPQIDN